MLFVSAPIFAQPSFADQSFNVNNSKLDTDLDIARSRGSINRTDETQDFVQSVQSDSGFGFWNTFEYFTPSFTGEKWAKYLMMRIAKDLKNVIMLLAVVYLIISVFRILLSGGGEEDVKKWKTSIIWTSLGIVVMQSAYSFVNVLYDKNVNGQTALDFSDMILYPFIHLLQVLASFAFLAMAFFAFYKIVTAGGDEERVKWGKRTIIYAILGFLLIKLPETLIQVVYGKVNNCFLICKIEDPKISGTITVFTKIINYINGFLGLVIVILVLYAGFLVLTSGGDDEKMKKAKNIVKYIVIGVLLLVTSYILFRFFLASGGR